MARTRTPLSCATAMIAARIHAATAFDQLIPPVYHRRRPAPRGLAEDTRIIRGYTWKNHMMCGILALALAAASLAAQHPNFEGIWNSATATPLERPERLKGKEFFTPQE